MRTPDLGYSARISEKVRDIFEVRSLLRALGKSGVVSYILKGCAYEASDA